MFIKHLYIVQYDIRSGRNNQAAYRNDAHDFPPKKYINMYERIKAAAD